MFLLPPRSTRTDTLFPDTTLCRSRKLQPDAITLDLGLSDIDGFVLLDLWKHDPQTSHIPIHVVSGADEASAVLDMGALGVTAKPAGHDELSRVFGALAEDRKSTRLNSSH